MHFFGTLVHARKNQDLRLRVDALNRIWNKETSIMAEEISFAERLVDHSQIRPCLPLEKEQNM